MPATSQTCTNPGVDDDGQPATVGVVTTNLLTKSPSSPGPGGFFAEVKQGLHHLRPNRTSVGFSALGGGFALQGSGAEKEKEEKKGPAAAVFADADAIRAKMHDNIDKKDYDVNDYYKETGWSQAIAKNNRFGNITLTVIAINALWIGFDADCNDSTFEGKLTGCPFTPDDKQFWLIGENSFCTFFTFELLIRFTAFREKMSAFRDNWFKFDAVLVGFMVVETWMFPVFLGGGDGAMSDFALLRMMRLLRLTRMVRLMRSVPELLTLLKGMSIAARSVAYTLLLLLIIMYIFGIIFKSQLGSSESLEPMFDHIPRSMWTLLWAGCFVDDINTVAEAVAEDNWIMGIFFLFFVLISALMVLNMLIGVLCAVVTAVAAAEKEKVLISYVKTRLIAVLQDLDQDGNGTLSRTEFDQLMNIPEAVRALKDLGVDVHNLMSIADHLFDPEDDDDMKQADNKRITPPPDLDPELLQLVECAPGETAQEQRSLTFADFLEMVIRLRSDNQPSVAEIVDLRKLVYRGQRQAAKRLHHIEKGQRELQRAMHEIGEKLARQAAKFEGLKEQSSPTSDSIK